MDTKLTLSLNNEIIIRAKAYAKENHTSLSQLLENYLSALTRKENAVEEEQISPLVKSLSGVLRLPEDYDYKNDRTQYLDQKYK